MYSSRSGGNVCSATAVTTCGCQRQDWALVGRCQTGAYATLAEYMMEGICLGTFMISACTFAAMLEHPASPVRMSIASSDWRRFLGGVAMGLTAVLLIYSPLGRRSGAHMNPATTLMFLRLGKIESWDAVFYLLSQFFGGVLGTLVAFVALGQTLAHKDVNFAITRPGRRGMAAAFVAEVVITFLLMTVILNVSNSRKFARYTGLAAGTMVMLFITFEAPLSGMSMNPARSFASDFVGRQWQAIWIYFTAPLIGMLTAAEIFIRTHGLHAVICAKLNHSGDARCIFRCGYMTQAARSSATD